MDWDPGPEFAIQMKIGLGGFSEVFSAIEKQLDRKVALKRLKPQVRAIPGVAERLLREAKAQAKLDHKNIVGLIRFVDRPDGDGFLVMKYIEGRDLAKLVMANGKFEPSEACRIVRAVAEAVAHAHDHGIIHRDLKPANVILRDSDGAIFVTDFGIAKILQLHSIDTGTSEERLIGTPGYRDPKYARGGIDERTARLTDVYGLGALLYVLATGQPLAEVEGEFPTRQNLEELPRGLTDFCLRCFDADLDRRFQTADEVVQALAGFELKGGAAPGTVAVSMTELDWGIEPSYPPVEDIFALLENAWKSGRPVVPLFGAGVSESAGVPTARALNDYLLRAEEYIATVRGEESNVEFLKNHGWPDPHRVNAHMANQSAGQPPASGPPRAGLDWFDCLTRLTENCEALQTDFLVQVVRGRRPSTCHQLIACLAKRMNWKVVLTTNFDNLIETALYNQEVRPVVFEVNDRDRFQDHPMVRGRPLLLKLHGSAQRYAPKNPISFEERERIFEYIPPDAILLVLGYSGGDRRVRELVQAHCRRPGGREPRVVWIHRKTKEPAGTPQPFYRELQTKSGDAAVRTAKYTDVSRFLQELYVRATSSHPISCVPYRVLQQVPPQSPWLSPLAGEQTADVDTKKVLIYYRDRVSYGTSSSLAAQLEVRFPTHRIIWCDMEEIPTVESLIAQIQKELSLVDPEVPPFALFTGGAESPPWDADDFARDPRIQRIVEGIQRDKYLLVIDSMGEFGNSHVADPPSTSVCEKILKEHGRLRGFLLALARRCGEFGESKVFIAYTRPRCGDGQRDEATETRFLMDVADAHEQYSGYVRVDLQTAPPFSRGLNQLVDDRDMGEWDSVKELPLADQIHWLWRHLKSDTDRVVLTVAAAFRRPRSLVALRWICAPIASHIRGRTSHQDPNRAEEGGDIANFCEWFFEPLALGGGQIWNRNLHPDHRLDIDDSLARLSAAGLLVRQEAGFYWMHRIARDEIYRCIADNLPSGERSHLGDLHDAIARYYYAHVFCHANDPAAFSEFVFHRMASIRDGAPSQGNRRLEDLGRVLDRHRDHLLTSGEADTLIGWIGNIQHELRLCYPGVREGEQLRGVIESQRLMRDIMATLCELEAEARRQSGDFFGCIGIRLRQIRHRLEEGPRVAQIKAGIKTAHWCDTWKQITDLVPEPGSDAAAPTQQQISEVVHSSAFVDILEEIVVRHAMYQVQDSSPAVAGGGFRLLWHIEDIAICMKSLRVEPERVADLLKVIQESTQDVKSRINPSVKAAAHRVQVQCAFRLVDLWTAHLSPWTVSEKDLYPEILRQCRQQLEYGQRLLQEYSGLAERDDSRLTCFLNTMGAATAYLQNEFTLAYHLLDAAEAVIWPKSRGSDRTSIAVCHLHRAESLMLHADYQLRKGTGRDQVLEMKGIEPEVWGSARGKLESASTELIQAHELLREARPNRWWWTWLYLLLAQWHHEWFALHLDAPSSDDWPRPGTPPACELPFDAPSQLYFQSALYAIRDGLDCVGIDQRRHNEFRILWWQHFLCRVFEKSRLAERFWGEGLSFPQLWSGLNIEQCFEDWVNRNRGWGLEGFSEEQKAEFSDVLTTWATRDWSDIDTMSTKRSNPYHNDCVSLRNILLTVEHELLAPMVQYNARQPTANGSFQETGQRSPR